MYVSVNLECSFYQFTVSILRLDASFDSRNKSLVEFTCWAFVYQTFSEVITISSCIEIYNWYYGKIYFIFEHCIKKHGNIENFNIIFLITDNRLDLEV